MKTILSVIEVIIYNLLPPAFAAPVVTVVKDIIPLLGLALIQAGLYVAIWFQKIRYSLFHNTLVMKPASGE